LLEDITEYGVSNISAILIVLAAVRYPKLPDPSAVTGAGPMDIQPVTTGNNGRSMTNQSTQKAYEISLNLVVEWQAHSLSNSGSQQSNRMLPRQQLLDDGSEVDAISDNIAKQRHASILRAYLAGYGDHLCSACAAGDARRASAASELGLTPSMENTSWHTDNIPRLELNDDPVSRFADVTALHCVAAA
jgi:hypothetical protein